MQCARDSCYNTAVKKFCSECAEYLYYTKKINRWMDSARAMYGWRENTLANFAIEGKKFRKMSTKQFMKKFVEG